MFSNDKKTILAVAVAGILVACALFGAIIYASNNDTGMIDKKVKVVSTDDSATVGLKDVVWTIHVPTSAKSAVEGKAQVESTVPALQSLIEVVPMDDDRESVIDVIEMDEDTRVVIETSSSDDVPTSDTQILSSEMSSFNTIIVPEGIENVQNLPEGESLLDYFMKNYKVDPELVPAVDGSATEDSEAAE